MNLSLTVPDHTSVSRRATVLLPLPRIPTEGEVHILIDSTGFKVYGAGQWLEEKHGARRGWCKLHMDVDEVNFSVVAHTLTDQYGDDPSQVGPLLDQIEVPIVQVTAGGAYDGGPTYGVIAHQGDNIRVAIPPRSTAAAGETTGPPSQRDRPLAHIQENEC